MFRSLRDNLIVLEPDPPLSGFTHNVFETMPLKIEREVAVIWTTRILLLSVVPSQWIR